MIDTGSLMLFVIFLVSMLILSHNIFRFDSELKHAGYVFGLISAILATLLLTNPSFLFSFSSVIGPVSWLLVAIGAIPIILLVIASILFIFKVWHALTGNAHWGDGAMLDELLTQHFNQFPEAAPQPQFTPAPPSAGHGNQLHMSETGREQIRQLIQVDKPSGRRRRPRESDDPFPMTRHRWPIDPEVAAEEAIGIDLD